MTEERKPKFKVGDKVMVRAGQFVILNAEITKVELLSSFIDYTLKITNFICSHQVFVFEEHFIFTKEEAKNNFLEWLND